MMKHVQLVFPSESSYNLDYSELYKTAPKEMKVEMLQQRTLRCKINCKVFCAGDSCGLCGRFSL